MKNSDPDCGEASPPSGFMRHTVTVRNIFTSICYIQCAACITAGFQFQNPGTGTWNLSGKYNNTLTKHNATQEPMYIKVLESFLQRDW